MVEHRLCGPAFCTGALQERWPGTYSLRLCASLFKSNRMAVTVQLNIDWMSATTTAIAK